MSNQPTVTEIIEAMAYIENWVDPNSFNEPTVVHNGIHGIYLDALGTIQKAIFYEMLTVDNPHNWWSHSGCSY